MTYVTLVMFLRMSVCESSLGASDRNQCSAFWAIKCLEGAFSRPTCEFVLADCTCFYMSFRHYLAVSMKYTGLKDAYV